MKKYLLSLLVICIATTMYSQYKIGLLPRASPDRGVYEKIGYTGIEVTYGSPKVNNRKIWGSLLPYNEVWRAGANDATRVEFSEDVDILGHILAAGKYSLFVVPKENDDWIIIFNYEWDQWGAFAYDETNDALRINVSPEKIKHVEKLTYSIDNEGFENGTITMDWEKIRLTIPIKTQFINILEEEVTANAENSPSEIRSVIYLQGAEYLLRRNQNIALAKDWIDRAIELYETNGDWHRQYYPKSYVLGHIYWTKAKIHAEERDYKLALLFGEKMKSIQGPITYYDEENEYEKIDVLLDKWKSS